MQSSNPNWLPAIVIGSVLGAALLVIDAVRGLSRTDSDAVHTKQAGQIHTLQEELVQLRTELSSRRAPEPPAVFVFCPERDPDLTFAAEPVGFDD